RSHPRTRRCGLTAAVAYLCVLALLAFGHHHEPLQGAGRAGGRKGLAWKAASPAAAPHFCPACALQRDTTAVPSSTPPALVARWSAVLPPAFRSPAVLHRFSPQRPARGPPLA